MISPSSNTAGLRSRSRSRSRSLTPTPSPAPGGPIGMIPSHTRSSSRHGLSSSSEKRSLGLVDLTVQVPDVSMRPDSPDAAPSRWRTAEFRVYALVFVLVVPVLVYWPMQLSFATHPNYGLYSYKLEKGWMFGWMVDASDPQYRSFRSGLPALAILATLYLVCAAVQARISTAPSDRARFIASFAVLMLCGLHGLSAFKPLLILYANYRLSRVPRPAFLHKVWPALIVVGNMGILFLNHVHDGYRFVEILSILAPLDRLNGIMRWHVHFNITMLRIISFMCDSHWRAAEAKAESSPGEYKARVRSSLPADEYSLVNFLAYTLYPPLYIAGPIMTFNDFTWQLRHPISLTRRAKLSYALRFLFCLLTMETILHTMYVVAIKDTHAWQGYSAADLSTLGFWNLVVVWLKLLIPWRYFRLWALLDNVDPPENMIRCIANNYSCIGFWKSWHRSYNLWLVRYIYVPLGGSKRPVISTVLVFTFVALWHDLTFKLLAWGWLVSLFIIPELLARSLVPISKFGHRPWYRHLAALGGTLNILMLMAANLVGFVLGLDGVRHLINELTRTWAGWRFLGFAVACLFVGVQVMFEYREEERRKGIDRKC